MTKTELAKRILEQPADARIEIIYGTGFNAMAWHPAIADLQDIMREYLTFVSFGDTEQD